MNEPTERPFNIRSVPPTPEQAAFNKEMTRRYEIRQNNLVPIYVMWNKSLPLAESQSAVQGIKDALIASGQNRELVIYGSQGYSDNSKPYSSPDWYLEEAKRKQHLNRDAGFGPQIDVSEVISLFAYEPYQQNPHWEVFITDNDLNDRGENGQYINFVFGATMQEFAASVQSIARLTKEIPPGDLRNAMIRRLLRHEVGHMFGLPVRNANTESSLGKHCSNVCTMRQGLSVQEWAKLTRQEEQAGVHFCKDCQHDLDSVRARYKPLPK